MGKGQPRNHERGGGTKGPDPNVNGDAGAREGLAGVGVDWPHGEGLVCGHPPPGRTGEIRKRGVNPWESGFDAKHV